MFRVEGEAFRPRSPPRSQDTQAKVKGSAAKSLPLRRHIRRELYAQCLQWWPFRLANHAQFPGDPSKRQRDPPRSPLCRRRKQDSTPACPPLAFWAPSPLPALSLSLSCCLFKKTAHGAPFSTKPLPVLLPLSALAPVSRAPPVLDPSGPRQGSCVVT